MKKIQPIKVKNLPLIWRQAIAQNKNRGFNFKTFFMQYIFSRNPFRKHSVFMTDFLILGSNPILNFMKLKDLIEKNKNIKENIKIALLTTNNFDYWGYHAFEKNDVWKIFSKKFNLNYQNIEDFFQSEISSLIVPENIEIVFVNDFNFSIYSIHKDNFVNGFILHLVDFKEHTIDIFSQMKNVFKAENNIRLKYYHLLRNNFYKKQTDLNNLADLSFPEKKTFTKDSNISSHIICAKEVFISSITNLIDSTVKEDTLTIMGEDIDINRFENWLYENSFGSANQIANSFLGLEFLAIDDFLKFNSIK